MSKVEVPTGMRVWYEHHRRFVTAPRFSAHPKLSPCGGETVAKLFAGDQDPKTDPPVATGVALCRPDENYNKRIGRDVALGRAVKALTNAD